MTIREHVTDALDLLALLLLAWGVGWVFASLWPPLGPLGAAAVILAGVQAIARFARLQAARAKAIREHERELQ